jgi:hypothetical protein
MALYVMGSDALTAALEHMDAGKLFEVKFSSLLSKPSQRSIATQSLHTGSSLAQDRPQHLRIGNPSFPPLHQALCVMPHSI